MLYVHETFLAFSFLNRDENKRKKRENNFQRHGNLKDDPGFSTFLIVASGFGTSNWLSLASIDTEGWDILPSRKIGHEPIVILSII